MEYIKNFEGRYSIDREGNIYSHRRKMYLTPVSVDGTKKGYRTVSLCNDEGKRKTFYIHRLVAMTFIENPENKSQVDHINEDRTDNRVENLRWCSGRENMNNEITLEKVRVNARTLGQGKWLKNGNFKEAKKPVYCIDLDITFESVNEAARYFQCHTSSISRVCQGKRKTLKGYAFKYL